MFFNAITFNSDLTHFTKQFTTNFIYQSLLIWPCSPDKNRAFLLKYPVIEGRIDEWLPRLNGKDFKNKNFNFFRNTLIKRQQLFV